MTGAPNPLDGRRILIVEDRYLIASELADKVRRLGARVLGPSPSVANATEILAEDTVEAALLDIDLEGELVYPLAELLDARGVPFVFVTGFDDETLPPPWRGRPSLTKPININELRRELIAVFQAFGAH